jgi:hypothetical protein
VANLHVTLSEEPPVPPPDADFAIKIEFLKGEGNPRRVFDAASLLIEGFEQFDKIAVASVDNHIEPVLVLEDIEAGSIKIWLRNVLRASDDDALKTLDWRPQVGKYLVRAKYAALRWLDGPGPLRLPNLAAELKTIAEETDVRHLPDYAPVDQAKLVGPLEKVQDAKKRLLAQDKLIIETEDSMYEVDLRRQASPQIESAERELWDEIPASYTELTLTVRKPDMIGDTKWRFRRARERFPLRSKMMAGCIGITIARWWFCLVMRFDAECGSSTCSTTLGHSPTNDSRFRRSLKSCPAQAGNGVSRTIFSEARLFNRERSSKRVPSPSRYSASWGTLAATSATCFCWPVTSANHTLNWASWPLSLPTNLMKNSNANSCGRPSDLPRRVQTGLFASNTPAA